MFYVYSYLRQDGTPYYVGKGSGNRAWDPHRNKLNLNFTPQDRTFIRILAENLTEEKAFQYEMYLIGYYGRKDIGTGILRNLTDGGDGMSGHVKSQETKDAISRKNKGKKRSAEYCKSRSGANHPLYGKRRELSPNYGKTHSPETVEKLSALRKGKSHLPETIEKIKKYKITDETRKRLSEACSGEKNGFYGKTHSPETIQKFKDKKIGENNPMYGKTHSPETIQLLKDRFTGKTLPTIMCPHCEKIGSISNMKRWHFDNCKDK